MEESGKVLGVAFVADGQASVAGESGDGAFDLPPVPAQPVVPVDSAADDAWNSSLFAQPPAVLVLVVALVGKSFRVLRPRGPRRDFTAGIALTIGGRPAR
nr:hypothetical protein GCM10017611_73340 [Rhodococcus wratislaviensis]